MPSDTTPVREDIRHGETGKLMDFFGPAALAQQVIDLCNNPAKRSRLGARVGTESVVECAHAMPDFMT
ncbi:hypothetical protein [Limnohabitans sp. Rim8]|uniref:hypothetical protein n=1 Tax=Limnohabitans sp. Rim8 TaxID=1100718 RepID=UPI00260D6E8E|nr:hypothetical protein [Limnohabitans sp. Rim8]